MRLPGPSPRCLPGLCPCSPWDVLVLRTESSFLIVPKKKVLIGILLISQISLRVLKFQKFSEISGFPLNLIAKTASPGPDVSVPSLGSMKNWQN